MAKLKLKSVQNSTECGASNLLANGSCDYITDDGYILDGSGIIDASGNVVESGWLEIEEGNELLITDGLPCFQIEANWDSGEVDLPLPYNVGPDGLEPCIPITFRILCILDSTSKFFSYSPLRIHWYSPLTAHITIPCVDKAQNDKMISYQVFTTFTIPFKYHCRTAEEEEE